MNGFSTVEGTGIAKTRGKEVKLGTTEIVVIQSNKEANVTVSRNKRLYKKNGGKAAKRTDDSGGSKSESNLVNRARNRAYEEDEALAKTSSKLYESNQARQSENNRF